ncbi:MAG: inorganic phosphate transporter [bacterium]|nr:MAG: inorganic phosphate transporter [bacterium]
MIWFFLLSGIFLGWSLGANDAANIFGTAVSTRMVKFKIAALIASIFVILGAVLSGAGTTETLGELGAINTMGGSFTVALASGLTVTWMTRAKLPVSTSQAIIGGILGWNWFTASPTDFGVLTEIISAWIFSPIIAALFAFILSKILSLMIKGMHIHLLRVDHLTRIALILIGAFGAYSLGANNIANVMGVFVPANPFTDIHLGEFMNFSGTQQLFLLGGCAISAGIYTYSRKVMVTVGNDLYKLTPLTALVVVLAVALVLYIFASENLQQLIVSRGLPPLPLVPVSSSQAVIGAVIGIGLSRGGKGIRYRIMGRISLGWIITPVAACLLTFILLFFVKNVFEIQVVK